MSTPAPEIGTCEKCKAPISTQTGRCLACEDTPLNAIAGAISHKSREAAPMEQSGINSIGLDQQRPDPMDMPVMDGWGSETSSSVPIDRPQVDKDIKPASNQETPETEEDVLHSLPAQTVLWEVLDVIRDWPAKIVRNTRGVLPNVFLSEIVREIQNREYPFIAQHLTVEAGLNQNSPFVRSALGLTSNRFPHLRNLIFSIQAEPEGKDLVIGVSSFRVNALKELCNSKWFPLTELFWGTGNDFNWRARNRVSELVDHVLNEALKKVEATPRDSAVFFSLANLVKTFDERNVRAADAQKHLQQVTQEEAELNRQHKNSLAPLERQIAETTDKIRQARENKIKLPKRIGWSVFGGIVALAFLVTLAGTFPAALVSWSLILGFLGWGGSKIFFVIQEGTHEQALTNLQSLLRNAQAGCEQQKQAFAPTVFSARSAISDAQNAIKSTCQEITKAIKEILQREAATAFAEEEAWFGARASDPGLDRLIQLLVAVVNDVQSRMFPNTQGFKLMDYE